MPKLRIDHLPMDRQAAGYSRGDVTESKGFLGPQGLSSVFEKRDIEPSAALLQRRTGSRRDTNAVPNLLGMTADINSGGASVDYDFNSEIADWTAFCTIRIPLGATSGFYPLFQLQNNCKVYISYTAPANTALLQFYTSGGDLQAEFDIGDLEEKGLDHRIMVRHTTAGTDKVYIAAWPVPSAGTTADLSGVTEVSVNIGLTGGILSFIGAIITTNDLATATAHDQVVLTNFVLYNVSDFDKDLEYEPYASDLTPEESGTSGGGTDFILRWHEKFSEGGDVLSFTNPAGTVIYGYLTPTLPSKVGDWIHFGGEGVIEVPFYLDFDEYYWTPSTGTARLEWMFQIEITLPKVLAITLTTIFEFQDILRLNLGTDQKLTGIYAGNGIVEGDEVLTAGETYQIFVGRDAQQTKLKIVLSSDSSTVETVTGEMDNPAIFNFDKMLGFIIGDTADAENGASFGGRIKRFALSNEPDQIWEALKEQVFYYDATSVFGDQIIDRGNRALNAYCGTRAATAPPFYKEGGFTGGSYVAAVGGYTLAGSTPDITYSGELKKALLKDAVIQRRGSKAFLTSNGVNYVIDDIDKSFRPLGIPRPATKVSCNPQGIGVLDGFVRYAYRWVTKDGTVGPAFGLDPVDARGGVNVFLGADSFGLPGETPFGISWGELEVGTTADAGGTVEWFLARDTDGSGSNNELLKGRDVDGLTLEVATRLPGIKNIKESIFTQGVYAPVGASLWAAVNTSQTFPYVGSPSQECAFQICFRYCSDKAYQTLFCVGHPDQRYTTGNDIFGKQTHWKLHKLVVSIQPPADTGVASSSLVICRDQSGGRRDNDLVHQAIDISFIDGRDYCVVIRRCGVAYGFPTGTDLRVSVYDATADSWTTPWPNGAAEQIFANFWPTSYKGGSSWKSVIMWGCCRYQGSTNITGMTRKRSAAGSTSFSHSYVGPLAGTASILSTGEPDGTVLYHGRMWYNDVPFQLFAQRGLERYAAKGSPLSTQLKADIAFCSDSSLQTLDGGWDDRFESRSYFKKSGAGGIFCYTHMTEFTDNTVLLAYGHDMSWSSGPGWTAETLDAIPLWITWSSRNEGAIVIGVGKYPQVEIATTKWHDGSEVQLFSDFADTIDFKSFTWITLDYHHALRTGATETIYDVWLERVFLDGNYVKDVYAAATNTPGIAANGGSSTYPYGLFSLGAPGISSTYKAEFAEVRLWDGYRYTAPGDDDDDSNEGGGVGDEAFGPYMSTRLPPNIWEELFYYIRFMKVDLDDEDTPTKLDQFGIFEFPDDDGNSQKTNEAVFLGLGAASAVATGAEVVDASDGDTSINYFVPFPVPPMSAIRGIQIFRTQVVPVTDYFPNGNTNPNAVSDAWRVCRDAPLQFLTEIPRGTSFYTDFADDTVLGTTLDQLTGMIPRNPMGIFEWEGHLGVFVADEPRIHFAESISSWESFPLDLIYDLPIKEKGSVKAAIELASRDARQSRVLVLGESWGTFLDGSPKNPQANTLGGGIGASSARCLVVEKGIAYAYNGTLWAITGDGQVEDIGLPVLDLLPPTDNARLSVSSALSSLLVIDESTGLVLRYYFPRGQWFVEDRYALSVTDKDGSDYWVHISGYPSIGTPGVYQDDVETNTPAVAVVAEDVGDTATTFTATSTGMKVGQRVTLVADRGVGDAAVPSIRQTVTIQSISGGPSEATITVEETIDLAGTYTDISGTVHTLLYNAYIGVGYWGTMLDTGQFGLHGDLNHVDIGVASGTKWWAASDASDFAKDPTDRSGFDSPESKPTFIGATAGRWGLSNSQRFARTIIWTPDVAASGLSEVELTYTPDLGERN